jgi:hypothetical protein
MKHVKVVTASMILAVAGAAMAQTPAVNGRLKPEYGPIQWVNTTPTQFGDSVNEFTLSGCNCSFIGNGIQVSLNNSNRAGVTGADATGAAAVTTGFEIAIPLSAIGNPAGAVRVAGMVTGGDLGFVSNQVIGGLTGTSGNLGESRSVDFTTIAGDQFITVSVDNAAAVPTLDGTLDASYGAPLFVQNNSTGFGDATGASSDLFESPGGSEIDGAYGKIIDGTLYLFITGNLESNFNKLSLYFDTGAAGGQNRLANNNCMPVAPQPTIFDSPNRQGGDGTGTQPGMKFDAGFAANYWLGATVGGGPRTMYADFAKLGSGGWGRQLTLTEVPGSPPTYTIPGQPVANGNTLVATNAVCPPAPPLPAPTDYAEGSEIDGVYATVCGDYLYLLVTGNLQVNGNRLDLFFDVGNTDVGSPDAPVISAGQNLLLNSNVRFDNGGLNRYGVDANDPVPGPGLRFSTGFNADYWISFRNAPTTLTVLDAWAARLSSFGAANDGNLPPNLLEYASFTGGVKSYPTPLSFDGTTCVRFNGTPSLTCVPTPRTSDTCATNGAGTSWNPGPTPNYGLDIQGDPNGVINTLSSCTIPEIYSSYAPRLISKNPFDPLGKNPGGVNLAEPGLIKINIDNSNRGGVTGDSAVNAKAVTSGVEFRIRLDELGYIPGSGASIKVTGYVTSGDHGFLSNQVIGGRLPDAQGNLGEPRAVDFNAAAFTQNNGAGPFYVTINPGTCATATTAACCFSSTLCAVMSQAQCSAVAGTYTPSSTTCGPTSCGGSDTSTCCRGTISTLTTAAACTAPAGVGVRFISGSTAVNGTSNTTPCCFADFNKDNARNIDDIFIYLNAWFNTASNPFTKIGGNGTTNANIDDLFIFINVWFAGGCG